MLTVLSAFADEISPELDVQLSVLKRLQVDALDLRSVDGTNVLALADADVLRVRQSAEAAGIGLQAVGSPVNKVVCTPENRDAERAKLQRAIEVAKILGTRRIRIFSPEAPESAWPEVRSWMDEQVQMAKAADVVLMHENDARFYGAYPEGARRLFEEFGGTHFRAAFDFANTVLIGYRPRRDWFPWLLPHLDTLHIKDAVEGQGVVPAGEGQGEMVETLRWLKEQGWSGPMTMEPHLQAAGAFGGFSGEGLFEVAVNAFRKTLSQV